MKFAAIRPWRSAGAHRVRDPLRLGQQQVERVTSQTERLSVLPTPPTSSSSSSLQLRLWITIATPWSTFQQMAAELTAMAGAGRGASGVADRPREELRSRGAVAGVSLDIPVGEFLTLLGRSGSGKTQR